jgi:hypothetical protein
VANSGFVKSITTAAAQGPVIAADMGSRDFAQLYLGRCVPLVQRHGQAQLGHILEVQAQDLNTGAKIDGPIGVIRSFRPAPQ